MRPTRSDRVASRARPTPYARSRRLAAGGCAIWLAACTLVDLRRQEAQDEARVHQKEVAVQDEQQRNDELLRRRQDLAAELEDKQLSLEQLQARLDALRTQNREAAAQGSQEQQARSRLLAQLQQTNRELVAARQAPQADPKSEARVAELKKQIREQLDLLLH